MEYIAFAILIGFIVIVYAYVIYSNSFGKIDDEVLAMASTIKFVDGSAVSLRQACEFIQSLENDPEDYAYLHSKILEMDFGVIPEIKHVCKKCSQVNKIPVSFRPEFFLPRYKF